MTVRLKPEFKAAWLAALRSGDYKQVRYQLRTSSGYCCLGVACDVHSPQLWRSLRHGPGLCDKMPDPNISMHWFAEGNSVEIEGVLNELAGRNDISTGYEFVIAYIEAWL